MPRRPCLLKQWTPQSIRGFVSRQPHGRPKVQMDFEKKDLGMYLLFNRVYYLIHEDIKGIIILVWTERGREGTK